MKKLIVCLTLAAFAMVSTTQAGEKSDKAKTASTKEKSACCAEAKTTALTSGCAEKTSCGAPTASACSSKKATAKKNHFIKGATLLVMR